MEVSTSACHALWPYWGYSAPVTMALPMVNGQSTSQSLNTSNLRPRHTGDQAPHDCVQASHSSRVPQQASAVMREGLCLYCFRWT